MMLIACCVTLSFTKWDPLSASCLLRGAPHPVWKEPYHVLVDGCDGGDADAERLRLFDVEHVLRLAEHRAVLITHNRDAHKRRRLLHRVARVIRHHANLKEEPNVKFATRKEVLVEMIFFLQQIGPKRDKTPGHLRRTVLNWAGNVLWKWISSSAKDLLTKHKPGTSRTQNSSQFAEGPFQFETTNKKTRQGIDSPDMMFPRRWWTVRPTRWLPCPRWCWTDSWLGRLQLSRTSQRTAEKQPWKRFQMCEYGCG